MKIIWMIDETIAQTNPVNWETVCGLENDLIRLIGKSDLQHEIVHPIDCLRNLSFKIRKEEFSCIFDLTGWLTPALNELFPFTPIENRFRLSRVRMVSSPELKTTGYTVSLSPKMISMIKHTLNIKKPLIIDDVSFSGWTSRKTMELWGLAPVNTSHAFLIANTGSFGLKPGAVKMLESLGSKIFFGFELHTPEEDGWHLKDLHQNQNLEQSFILALIFQEVIREGGFNSPLAQKIFSLKTFLKTLFPDSFSTVEIKELINQNRFVLLNENCLENEAIHAKNPFLWASPYFQEHLDIEMVIGNRASVIKILRQLQELTRDPEAIKEAGLELKREMKALKSPKLEGCLITNKERIL